ncbi:MAG: hypothetical protein DCC58_12025 [Chloroflexi bacterium]|nr:MAG: hypothetical protein DCC58_12025 [Chloroflexota bacterium]
MLTAWTLGNFGSVGDTTTLELGALTIVCGANSSGKSTIIKSLLVVSQSLGSSAWEESLLLNGRLVRAGSFDDILHAGAGVPEITVEFAFTTPEYPAIELSAQIDVTRAAEGGNGARPSAVVRSCSLRARTRDDAVLSLELLRRTTPPVGLAALEQMGSRVAAEHIRQGLFNYTIRSDDRTELVDSGLREEVLAASLQNVIPGRLLVRSNPRVHEATRQIQAVISVVETLRDRGGRLPAHLSWNQPVGDVALVAFAELRIPPNYPQEYRDIAYSIGRSKNLTLGDLRADLEPLARRQRGIMDDLIRRLSGAIPELQRLAQTGSRSEGEMAVEVRPFPAAYNAVLGQIREELGRRVHYLGPLRDDPRPVYAMPDVPNRRDVGLKGEYTAAMLQLFGDRMIEIPPLPSDGGAMVVSHGTLAEGVRRWLAHLGMATDFATEETLKVGYRLSVHDAAIGRDLDLTSVGVGVSQVLPVLVMPLLAPRGSILIFEQPEVHLHPRVQSGLADFFAGVVACGKQCIIETHSEHIINRLRRRIAEDGSGRLRSDTRIYFATRPAGVSVYRLVQPNEYGAILEWPTGFFDEAESEANALLSAALAKRREASGEGAQREANERLRARRDARRREGDSADRS